MATARRNRLGASITNIALQKLLSKQLPCGMLTSAAQEASGLMRCIRVLAAGITNPFGDHRTVTQAFPAAISSEDSDPFLMCDNYAFVSDGIETDPDRFPVAWHPHRGMDIVSYLKTGQGRHGDSMGNRESFATPGA